MAVTLETGSAPAVTAQDLIKRAYKILGEIASGESMTAEQANDGLDALNSMLDSFTIEKLMVYVVKQQSFTWPASTTSRTIGPSGDFNTRRPERIGDGTFFEDSNNISYPVQVTNKRSVYDLIPDKTVTSSYPDILFYEQTVDQVTMYVWPIPNQSLTMNLNSWNALQVFDTLTETMVLPAGYRQMIEYNLAVHLSSIVGLPVPAQAVQIAAESKRRIKRFNHIPIISKTDVYYALRRHGRADIVAGR